MKRITIILFLLSALLFTGCIFPASTPSLEMQNFDSTFAPGETITIDINVDGIRDKIFAVCLRIAYDPDYVSFEDSQTGWIGTMWSDEAIGILEADSNTVYISISEIAGADDFIPRGEMLSLDFTLEQSGTTLIDYIDDQIFFYDEEGSVINITEIEVTGYSLTIE